MDLLALISKGVTPVIDFRSMKGDVKPFLARYGGHLKAVGIVAKDEVGRGYLDSSIFPPAAPDQGKFLPSAADLFQSVGIKVYAIVHGFLDSRAGRDAKLRTVNRFGRHNDRFSCPTNPVNQTSFVKFIGELASTKLIDKIIAVDAGFVRKEYCFCESCQKAFAERKQLSLPVTMDTLTSRGDLLDDWIQWRAEVINSVYEQVSKQVAEAISKTMKEVTLYGAIDLDERTKYSQGAFQNFGQQVQGIANLVNIAARLQPWTPIMPTVEMPEYRRMLEDLKTIRNYLEDCNREGLILTWNIENEEELDTVKVMAKALSTNIIMSYQGFPPTIGSQRDAHLGLDLESR